MYFDWSHHMVPSPSRVMRAPRKSIPSGLSFPGASTGRMPDCFITYLANRALIIASTWQENPVKRRSSTQVMTTPPVTSSCEDFTLGSSPGRIGTTVQRQGEPLQGSRRYGTSSCSHFKVLRVLSRSVSSNWRSSQAIEGFLDFPYHAFCHNLGLERLRGLSERHPAQMAGDLMDAPQNLSLRHLSRNLTRSIHSKAVSDLWKQRPELEDTIRYQWLRNLPGDSPAQPDSYHGHGEWLHCLPGRWETTLLDPVFRLGLGQFERLGYLAPGTGQRCGRTPSGCKQCQYILDPHGRHVACCNVPKGCIPVGVTASGI